MVVIRAHASEKASRLLEENVITLIVERNATKHQIKRFLEERLGVKVVEVRTLITSKGEKKAYVKLAPGFNARDLAVKLGTV
ncbi:MAG: 50S ribosomal protein L23 [Acidilobaceae archaeon]|nr:50S ribosomal protein L23 [Acidilobaceae archaeon]